MTRFPTHVVKMNGGELVEEIGRTGRESFAAPLRRRNGRERWGIGLFPIPEDTDYDEMRATGTEFTEFLQAGGSAEALTVEIRKPGGDQWGCKWVRYVVGHRDGADGPLVVDIPMPHGPERIKAAEVFDAEEAADLFYSYYQSGDIPEGYALRPVEGYLSDGSAVGIPSTAT
jgi:hypothetical protein